MLDFERTTMLAPNVPLSDVSSSDIIMRSICTQDKYSPGHLYLRQPHSVQIIQLVEGPPPPPRRITSVINDSSAASSSSSCDYSSQYSESASENDQDDEEEEESACSSYCSSDLPPEELEAPPSLEHSRVDSSTETYSIRMKRILAWRENFSAHLGSTFCEPSLPSLKRKLDCDEDDDDNVSHSSKRSRSQASSHGGSSSSVISSLGIHSCPACDASFDTQQSLRQHGLDAKANEACCVAVEYAFE